MTTSRARIAIASFAHGPFPLRKGHPFFDRRDGARRGRTTRHGEVFWEQPTYSSRDVLLAVPHNFDARETATMVVYLHGNRARLERDVVQRQQLVRQVCAADINAVLVAPQLALDAPDSSAGRFAQRGVFRRFLDEAADGLGTLGQVDAAVFRRARVILIAYSGGYCPAAAALRLGGVRSRVRGVVLLDALYDHAALFAAWFEQHHRHAFLVSAYTHSTRRGNVHLRGLLQQGPVVAHLGLRTKLAPGNACLVPLDGTVEHADVVTRAWCDAPVTDLLRRAGRA
jgi:hypothetical protein